MVEQTQCPICASELIEHNSVLDHFGNQERFSLNKCKDCNLLVTSPQPNREEIIGYYRSNNYVSHGDSKGFLFDKAYQLIQNLNHSYKLKLIKQYSLNKKLLDFGAGAGSFAQFAATKGYDVTAVEPDTNAQKLITSSIEKFTDIKKVHGPFDIITSYHVLEHVHDFVHTLKEFKERLTPNGVLHIALPNFESHDAQYYGSYWAGLDVPRHLFHFSQKSINNLVEKIGLNLVGIHPMKFDSYYASLLSEQYRNSKFPTIKAARRGYLSNSKAAKSKEYSSLIYIISH